LNAYLGDVGLWMAGLSTRQKATGIAALMVVAIGLLWLGSTQRHHAAPAIDATDISSQAKRSGFYRPTAAEWATLVAEPVEQRSFRTEQITEGKISINEDRATPIFSPYAGRVTKLLAKPGDVITRGQPLFFVEATDTVQGLNDFMSAATALNKARSSLDLARIVEKRNHDLYDGKAVALKEWQQAQAELTTAQNDMRSAETTLEAARNRLHILGRSDEEIATFQETGKINAETAIPAPLSGTIVQRKVGPGQYVSSGSSDPVFIIGDLSDVWITAFVRETDAAKVSVGQDIAFTALAYPNKVYAAKIDYVAATLDPASRRLLVRATVTNPEGQLKPEMFATVTIFGGVESRTVAAPREALIYEGDLVRAWVVRDDQSIELRQVRTGLVSGRMVQILDGLQPGERVITKGSLFIDRVAAGS